jgi:hypothetical protein
VTTVSPAQLGRLQIKRDLLYVSRYFSVNFLLINTATVLRTGPLLPSPVQWADILPGREPLSALFNASQVHMLLRLAALVALYARLVNTRVHLARPLVPRVLPAIRPLKAIRLIDLTTIKFMCAMYARQVGTPPPARATATATVLVTAAATVAASSAIHQH